MSDLTFKECPSCAAKPGTPVLCESCLHNRRVITELASRVAASPHFTLPKEEVFLDGLIEQAADEHMGLTERRPSHLEEDGHRAIAFCNCKTARRYRDLKGVQKILRTARKVYVPCLQQIAGSAREASCSHVDCSRYGDRPQSRGLQNLAKKALEGEWDGHE